ncbi:hypothetical protein QE411_001504 [Microbacterium arborescens]|nr:hypothetical protein [Microbacterium arborescens]
MALGRDLVARHLEHARGRTDERDARVGSTGGELGVLGQEAVSRVDRVRPALARDADDLVDVEVGPDGASLHTDLVSLVGLQPVERVAILVRIDGHGARPQLEGGTEGADGDLTAIRDKDLAEHAHLAGMSRTATAPREGSNTLTA